MFEGNRLVHSHGPDHHSLHRRDHGMDRSLYEHRSTRRRPRTTPLQFYRRSVRTYSSCFLDLCHDGAIAADGLYGDHRISVTSCKDDSADIFLGDAVQRVSDGLTSRIGRLATS